MRHSGSLSEKVEEVKNDLKQESVGIGEMFTLSGLDVRKLTII